MSASLFHPGFERLLPAAAAGNPHAWEALVARFQAQLLRTARRRGLTPQQAEDAVQETWLRLLRHIDQVREPRALGGWLVTTTGRESERMRRRAARELPCEYDPRADIADTTASAAVAELEQAILATAVGRALDSLPARQRGLMRALFAETVPSYREVSERLGIPIGSIGPIRARCLARLRLDGDLSRIAE